MDLQKALSEEYGTTEKSKIFNKIYDIHFEMVKNFIVINSGTKPATASWFKGAISSFTKFNNNKEVKLYQITVTFLRKNPFHHYKIPTTRRT